MKALKTIHAYDLTLFNRLNHARLNADLMQLYRSVSKTGDGHLYLLRSDWAFLIGLSRVLSGVHFPTDPVVGMHLDFV